MSDLTINLTLKKLSDDWEKVMPNCGVTNERRLFDPKFNLEWRCLFNYKRMLRRTNPSNVNKGLCSFCLAATSNENKLGTFQDLDIYGNKYPIEPKHFLFFNNKHKVDPSVNELEQLTKLASSIPELKILLSNRPGSGASIPNHLHVHAFTLDLPIEKSAVRKEYKVTQGNLQILDYPAWTVKLSNTNSSTRIKLLDCLIKSYHIPFNISFIKDDLYIIPRKIESPEICEETVDGVGSLETAGIYTTVSENALHKITLETFREGLSQASYTEDPDFQKEFIEYCIKVMEEK